MKEENTEEAPPILGSWKNLYWLVIGNLAFMILLFYLFTEIYK